MSAPTNVKIKKAKAADPGFAFELDIDTNGRAINDTLQVQVSIWDTTSANPYVSAMQVRTNINQTSLRFVAPFGDGNYQSGQTLRYQLSWAVPYTAALNDTPLSGVVFAEGGQFELQSDIPDSIASGGTQKLLMNQTMRSIDDNYVGLMQGDGNFCVYQQFNDTPGATGLNCTDTSWTDRGLSGCYVEVDQGRAFVKDASGEPLAASPANPADPNGSLVISTNGRFALRSANGTVTEVTINPQNLP